LLIQAGIINGEQVQTSSGKTFNVDSEFLAPLAATDADVQTQRLERSSARAPK
jgi:hypothetical protein